MVNPTKLIEAVLDVPDIVEISPNDPAVKLTVQYELANHSKHDYMLHAPNMASQQFWHVMDRHHREIYREQGPGNGGGDSVRSMTIAAGHSSHEALEFKLDTKRLRAGQTYTIRGESWGQICEAAFTVVEKAKAAVPQKKRASKPKPTGIASKKQISKKKKVAKKQTRKKKASGKKR